MLNKKTNKKQTAIFAPQLFFNQVAPAVEFYEKAFDAKELRRFSNSDGTIHVAEMTIEGALFHLHEDATSNYVLNPKRLKGTSVIIELLVEDPDAVMAKALTAGAIEKSSLKNHDYGFRQGDIIDPFGHYWIIEKDLRNK